jgi:hypothetical protein
MSKDVQEATKGVDVDARKEALQIAVGELLLKFYFMSFVTILIYLLNIF